MKNNIADFGRHLEEHEQVVVDGVTVDGAHVRAWGALTLFDDCTERIHEHGGDTIRKRPAYFVELNGGSCFVFREYEFHVPGTEPAQPGDDEPAFELADDDDEPVEPFPSLLAQHGGRGVRPGLDG